MANATATIQSKSYTPANKRQTVLYIREKRKKKRKKGGNKETKGFKWVATCHDATEDMILRELS